MDLNLWYNKKIPIHNNTFLRAHCLYVEISNLYEYYRVYVIHNGCDCPCVVKLYYSSLKYWLGYDNYIYIYIYMFQ